MIVVTSDLKVGPKSFYWITLRDATSKSQYNETPPIELQGLRRLSDACTSESPDMLQNEMYNMRCSLEPRCTDAVGKQTECRL
ncbi:hypothetical protein AVEN_110177-1 [Araneus ventricosus]|uniref:Uncharacterized protein n=1 Tax=Araneus ventricosus TaxID=182803 RepID=A0A4Y2MP87_ARAVE|nr:hypothetical protein AVEN_110177-1 [Araneus ventricosus]